MSVQDKALHIQQQLAAGKTVVGCFLSLGSALTAEIMGAAGYDCAVIDLEHGSGDERAALDQLQALSATNCVGMVRVESNQRQRVHRMLDTGAHGLMFPRIDSPEEARAAIAAMRYPPDGVRGVASSVRACEYGANFLPYLEGSKHLLSMIQIESEAAVACVDEIAAVPGVDVLFLGPWDLSFGMGIMGQFDHPRFVAAVERTSAAAARHGKVAGILLPSNRSVAHYHALGYRFILSGADAIMMQQAARAAAKSLLEQREAVDAGR
jgi:4-hydroxy-2-oxoheptanedioate aldolase